MQQQALVIVARFFLSLSAPSSIQALKQNEISEVYGSICMVSSKMWCNYSRATTAPRPSNVFFIFSASSFDMFVFKVCGSDSTNFFACITYVSSQLDEAIWFASHLHERQVRVHGLDFPDDLRLGSCVEGREFNVEDGLFLWFLL